MTKEAANLKGRLLQLKFSVLRRRDYRSFLPFFPTLDPQTFFTTFYWRQKALESEERILISREIISFYTYWFLEYPPGTTLRASL